MNPLREKIEQIARRSEKVWGLAYPRFAERIREKGLTRGVEIGVAFGGHAEAILDQAPVERLYGIDPYEHQENYNDPMNLSQEDFDEVHRFVLDRMGRFGERYSHLRTYSEKALDQVEGSVDFVYIDALHTFDGVWGDLCRWFGRVRDGGLVGGHDYGHPSFPGVKEAVDRFFRRFDWTVHEEGDGVWWVEKRPLPISFFIPAYNCETTVEQSVESILKTNLSPGDEIVIVNDGSTDGTSDLLARMKENYPPVRIVNHPFNKGGSAARNTAVEHAQNSLLFCLDSDNILAENSIAPLKAHLLETGADVAGFEQLHMFNSDPHGEPIIRKWIFRKGWTTVADFLASPYVLGASGNYMFTRESWRRAKGYPVFAGAYDAWGFGFNQAATGSAMTVLADTHYFHRVGHDSYLVQFKRENNTSMTVLRIILPFAHLIHEKDLNYIMGPRGRYTWFENILKRPIRLKNGQTGQGGGVESDGKKPSKIMEIGGKVVGKIRSLKDRNRHP